MKYRKNKVVIKIVKEKWKCELCQGIENWIKNTANIYLKRSSQIKKTN